MIRIHLLHGESILLPQESITNYLSESIDESDRVRQIKNKLRETVPARACDSMTLVRMKDEEQSLQEEVYVMVITPFSFFVDSYLLPDFRHAIEQGAMYQPLSVMYDPDSCMTELEWYQYDGMDAIIAALERHSFPRFAEQYPTHTRPLSNSPLCAVTVSLFRTWWVPFANRMWVYVMNRNEIHEQELFDAFVECLHHFRDWKQRRVDINL